MKSNLKLALLAAMATMVSGTAYADDPQLQNRLSVERQIAERNRAATTIGVYAGRRAIGEREAGYRRGTTDASGRPTTHIHKMRGEAVEVPVQR